MILVGNRKLTDPGVRTPAPGSSDLLTYALNMIDEIIDQLPTISDNTKDSTGRYIGLHSS